jgi:hypothetical protein
MSLLAEIMSQPSRRKGSRCTISVILTQLDAKDADELVIALADPFIPNVAISRVLRKRDQVIAPQTVGRHRRGDCLCRSATS